MLLAINTAFLNANLGLILDNGERFTRTIDAKSKHSENVLKTIDEMCEEAGVIFKNIDKVAIVIGPGSFTGIRIGVAIVKALGAVMENLKVFPITSLELMAYIYLQNRHEKICCVLNALSNLFFIAEFDEKGNKVSVERMVNVLPKDKKLVILEGDLNLENAERVEITSENLLDYVTTIVGENDGISSENVEPLYIRPSQAEANLKSSKKNV